VARGAGTVARRAGTHPGACPVSLRRRQRVISFTHLHFEIFVRRAQIDLPERTVLLAVRRRVANRVLRPHLLLEGTPQRTPWLTPAKFLETGGIVVWRASDTSGTPPPDIAQRFPGLVPEVPRSFEPLVNGRQPLLRIGWAIVRPKGT